MKLPANFYKPLAIGAPNPLIRSRGPTLHSWRPHA
jgi:hypothetical protein